MIPRLILKVSNIPFVPSLKESSVFQWIDHRPKTKCKDITLLENHIGETLDDLGHDDFFLDIMPKA